MDRRGNILSIFPYNLLLCFLFCVMPFKTVCQNWSNKDIDFILGSLKRSAPCWSVARFLLPLIRDSLPSLRCQGSVQAPRQSAWYQCSQPVGDRQTSLLLSTSRWPCPYMPSILNSPWTLEDTEDMGQFCCWVAEIEKRNGNLGWCYCCHSDRKIKPPGL